MIAEWNYPIWALRGSLATLRVLKERILALAEALELLAAVAQRVMLLPSFESWAGHEAWYSAATHSLWAAEHPPAK